jgi:hypothetical protein
VAQAPDGAMLLVHLGQQHPDQANLAKISGLFRGFGDDGMPLAHVLDPHEPYSGQQEGT